MRRLRQMQRMGSTPILFLHPFFAFDTTSSLTQCYHLDADANVDARVNGPLHPFFAFDTTSSLTQCYHLDADANVDARVNGPLHQGCITHLALVPSFIQSVAFLCTPETDVCLMSRNRTDGIVWTPHTDRHLLTY